MDPNFSRLLHRRNATLSSGETMVRRATVPTIALERVSRHATIGGKPKPKEIQAWKYPNNEIVRAPSLYINGRKYYDVKEKNLNRGEKPRRLQESNFFITINPNQRYCTEDSGLAQECFRKALTHLNSNTTLATIIKFGPKDCEYLDDRFADVIKNIDWSASVEVGDNLGRMHCHIWMTVSHYSQIQINIPMLREEFFHGFNTALGGEAHRLSLNAAYFQVKLLPQSDATTIIRQYTLKGMSC